MKDRFIGGGLTFPIVLDEEGRPEIKTDTGIIEASINHILSWALGTRFFNEGFGSRLSELLEEPHDGVLRTLLRRFVIEALADWERRVDIIEIEISDTKNAKIDIYIRYRVTNTQIEETFIFPYYREIIF